MNREAMLQTLQFYLAACERRDISAIVGCFAGGGRIVDPLGEQIGTEAIQRYFEAIYRDLVALSFEIGPASWCVQSCAVPWKGRGRRRDGSDVRYQGIDVLSFTADHLIRELWAFWAPDDLLGVTEPEHIAER